MTETPKGPLITKRQKCQNVMRGRSGTLEDFPAARRAKIIGALREGGLHNARSVSPPKFHRRVIVEERIRLREPIADGNWIGVAERLEHLGDFGKRLAAAIELKSGMNPAAAACGARGVDR